MGGWFDWGVRGNEKKNRHCCNCFLWRVISPCCQQLPLEGERCQYVRPRPEVLVFEKVLPPEQAFILLAAHHPPAHHGIGWRVAENKEVGGWRKVDGGGGWLLLLHHGGNVRAGDAMTDGERGALPSSSSPSHPVYPPVLSGCQMSRG